MTPTTALAPRLSFAIMGAGAVGCYFGALLAQAGHTVRLVARPTHVQAITSHGLRLQTATQDTHVPLQASTDASAVQGADVVLLCVKSTDTQAAAQQMQPHLAPGALVLTLQNGVDNDARVRAVLGPSHPVIAAVVYVATAMAGPGHVRHFGRGELVVGPSPASAHLAQALAQAGIPTEVSDNVCGALWAKLVINCAYNALSAIVQQPYGWLVAQEGACAVIDDLVTECLAVARADNIQLPDGIRAAVQDIARTMAGQRSSTAQDLARGHPTEIAHLNGYVVQRGAALGVPTPVNRAMLVLVRMLEAKLMAKMGSSPC